MTDAQSLASKLGISIDTAQRYLATGLSCDNIEACAKFATNSTISFDDIVDMAARLRERDQEKQLPKHNGTIRRSRRFTGLGGA